MTGAIRGAGVQSTEFSSYKPVQKLVVAIINATPIGNKAKEILVRIAKVFNQIINIAKEIATCVSQVFKKMKLLAAGSGVTENGALSGKKTAPRLFQEIAIVKQIYQAWKQGRFMGRINKTTPATSEEALVRQVCDNILKEEDNDIEMYSGFKPEILREQVGSIVEKLRSINAGEKNQGIEDGKKLIKGIKRYSSNHISRELLSAVKLVAKVVLPIIGAFVPPLAPLLVGVLAYLG